MCITFTSILHYGEVVACLSTAVHYYLVPLATALRSRAVSLHDVAEILLGNYNGDELSKKKFKTMRLMGEQCNVLLLNFPDIMRKIPYPPETHAKLRLKWRVMYACGLELRELMRELSRMHISAIGPLANNAYLDNLCTCVRRLRFVFLKWFPPRVTRKPQIRFAYIYCL